MRNPGIVHWLTFLLTSLFVLGTAQNQASAQEVYLSGFTRDSLSLEPLPYVNLSSSGQIVAASDLLGFFTLTCQVGDTIVFTRIGYKPLIYFPARNNWDLLILLPETAQMLQNVTIYDRFSIHGESQIQKILKEEAKSGSSPYRNQTLHPDNPNMVQTFGPGLVVNGAFSRWSKSGKEKLKLRRTQEETSRSIIYREFIHSMQVKQYIMNLFGLHEEEYLKRLEGFIINTPQAAYFHTRREIIDLLVPFFASQKR